MGHQLNFYMAPADLLHLEQELKARCPMLILDYRSEQPAPRLLSTLEVADFGKTWLTIFLTPLDMQEALAFKHVPKQGYWTVDLRRSPAIELSRCFYDGAILRRGRLYYDQGFYDETGQWIEKHASFLSWARKVFAVTRKGLQRDAHLQAYVGKSAQEESQQGRLKLVST